MKRNILSIITLLILIISMYNINICADTYYETPVSICCIGDIYSVDYIFDISGGEVEDVRGEIPGGIYDWNYSKSEARLYISFASANVAKKSAQIATVLSAERITLTPIEVKLNGWKTETACIYHAETDMPNIPPTCDKNGSTGGTFCTRCGVTLIEPEIIPATGPQIKAVLSENGVLNITGAITDNAISDDTVILAVYKGDQLMICNDLSKMYQNNVSLEFENMLSADTVKVFRWSNIVNMKPLYDVVEFEVENLQ